MNLANKAVEILDADILAIHLNPLQESIQPEGDLDARGYLDLISKITDMVDIPVWQRKPVAAYLQKPLNS